MSDSAWVLKGVDPETRDRAVEEAQRLGVSLADYVTDKVLKNALSQQVGALVEAEPAPAGEPSDFGVRHRFRALERRLESSVGSLDSSLAALDAALFDITARVGEVEGLAGDTAHALQQALAEMAGQLAAVRLHIADVEENSLARDGEASASQASLSQAFTGLNYRTESIGQQLEDVEAVARRADTNAAVLADAHEALKHAVAADFSAFAQDISDRLSHGLRDVAAAAEDAAAQADAAVAHLVVELRGVRATLEQSVADGVDETRRRIHAAFSDAGARIDALSERIDTVEVMSLRANEQLRIRLTDIEDAAQTSLEETAETLRQAGAALAADLQRSIQDGRAALESVHGDLAGEIAELRERQQGAAARLKQMDAAAGGLANDLTALRESMLRRIADSEVVAGEAAARIHDELGEQLGALASRFARHEDDTTETNYKLRAETERVEASTLAALEKLANDIRTGDAALHERINANAAAVTNLIDQLNRRVEAEFARVHEQQSSAAARLTVIDLALGAQTQLAERVDRIEADLGEGRTETKLAAIDAQLGTLTRALADRSDAELVQRIEELRARLAAYENHASVAADGVNDLVRMLGRVTTQNAETAAKAEERVHNLEMALADLKLDHLAARDKPAATPDDIAALQWRVSAMEQRKPEALATLEQRLGEMEGRQVEALEALRADIVRFVADNDRRLAALESPEIDYNLAAEFDALRRRVEERILGVEQRSVRTLEQVADTVQMLEERFMGRDEGERQSA
jgi:localization factor PodJL